MFWELRRNSLEGDMRALSRLLADFFSYAAAQGETGLDEEDLRRAFPRERAQWLLDQLHGEEKNREALRSAVGKLFQLPPGRRRAIAEALNHDMDFDRAAAPGLFFLEEPFLPEEERKIVKDVFQYFYGTVFRRNRRSVFPGAAYDRYAEANHRANGGLRACPVCLSKSPDIRRESDLDHYLPRSAYPSLSLHPGNLLFICKECNETYKGTRDALKKGKKPLGQIFLPYRDTVKDHAAISIRRVKNTDTVELKAVNDTREERERIKNFNSLYQLEKRWSGEVEGIFKEIRTCCAGRGLTREEVREKLRGYCEDLRALSDFPDKFVEAAYVEWLYGPMFDAFYDSL